MAQLAIRGHATRGYEVIEILEMLGGKNKYNVDAIRGHHAYFIENGIISTLKINQIRPNQFIIFTLEEFLEKFPYKGGDKVLINDDVTDVYTITSMAWVGHCVAYKIRAFDGIDDVHNWFADEMKPYTEHIEETMEEKIESFEIVEGYCADEVKIEFDPSKYEMVEREEGYYVVKKQLPYPQTFEECCTVLGLTELGIIGGYRHGLLTQFRNLLICRDAYWKIAGEEMGLDKPWEPDWSNFNDGSYPTITKCNNRIIKTSIYTHDCILAFPTEEL